MGRIVNKATKEFKTEEQREAFLQQLYYCKNFYSSVQNASRYGRLSLLPDSDASSAHQSEESGPEAKRQRCTTDDGVQQEPSIQPAACADS